MYLKNSITYRNVVKWWLTGMLFFIPFQRNIVKLVNVWSPDLAVFINRVDDITLIVFIPITIMVFYRKRKEMAPKHISLVFIFSVICVTGIISGMVNGNSLHVTILGIFDYIKIFLFIFVYAAFFSEFSTIEKIFRSLLIVAVILGGVALIQELWALSYRYILGKDIHDTGMYIFHNLPKGTDAAKSFWRFGIYRAPSLVGHYNLIGFYSLFIFTVYVYSAKKIKGSVCFFLLAGMVFSMSRMIYLGLVVLLVLQIIKGRKWFLYLIIPIMIPLFYMSTLWDFNFLKFSNLVDSTAFNSVIKDREHPEIKNAISYREYTQNKAMAVWKDHPLWGVGPGMFGGTVSVLFNSPVFEEYNFQKTSFFKQLTSIDQIWPQVLAEMGIVGAVSYAGLLISLIIVLLMSRQNAISNSMMEFFTGLSVFTIIIIIWGFGGAYKNAVIYTYVAFAGMGLSSLTNKN